MNATITVALTVPPGLTADEAGDWLAGVLAAARNYADPAAEPAALEPDADEETEEADEAEDVVIAERPVHVPPDVTAVLRKWTKYIARQSELPGWLIDQLRLMVGELLAGGAELATKKGGGGSYLRILNQRGSTLGYIRSTSVTWTMSQLAYGDALGNGDWPRMDLTRHPRDAAAMVLNAVHHTGALTSAV